MPWVIFAAVVWLFIILFLRAGFGRCWSAAVWAILVGYFLNNTFVTNGFYTFQELLYQFQGLPIGYLVGLAGIGVIIVYYLPDEKTWHLPYLILFSLIFTAIEIFAVEQGYLIYLNWSLLYSFFYKLLAFIVIAWLSNLTIRRRKGFIFR